ncbi:methylated-DNA--[protein]-cysteine S-methyltransferase [Sinosporangium siamense]|uniref:methylated-DNA--[protein]-cysteine S-methyltransferase n=1 Tax=Sinosporangium siamense TaxID=1367973 RepID=A0A919RA99_9ACTN|nr:methylated-DNA--[protein]-cysteine S-methyltransferase [Sinosporangium siamense]GII89917.1 methylated-DNA--protein-cysteine methyltransferase [Sinosporangium siamense]
MSGTVAFGGISSPLGQIMVALTEDGLAATDFRDGPAARARTLARLGLPEADDPARVSPALQEMTAYFAGELRAFTVPVDWRLFTPLQRQVLGTLYDEIGYGEAVTYGELATRSGAAAPARAIGSIMGANPVPIVVPCHRVIAGNGLGGFSGGEGVESKRRLLTLEGYLQPTLDWDL